MKHYQKYIKRVKKRSPQSVADSIKRTVEKFIPEHIDKFDFLNHKSALLLGHVQSGKTVQMLGILTATADAKFQVFLVMTADNNSLQSQTLGRALELLGSFCVCGESDYVRFFKNDMQKPVVIVIKKNSRILNTWKNNLASSGFLGGRSIFIIDDEGDVASLNTMVNQDKISTINKRITAIKELANSSFYLQVTATPQSLFLQEETTGYKPESVHYFEPGYGYLGGDFFYNPRDTEGGEIYPAYHIQITNEDELSDLKDEDSLTPEGMQRAISSFLVSVAHMRKKGREGPCNFLVHPSVSIKDHEAVAEKIGEALNVLLSSFNGMQDCEETLKVAWEDLKKTKNDIIDFGECYNFIVDLLEDSKVSIFVMNSKNSGETDFSKGINIIVGGNSLARGVTFPNLNTTYYCRKSKHPQADTFWQHCRAFGYDRDVGLVRIFLPSSLFNLFSQLNNSNNAMIERVKEGDLGGQMLAFPKGVKPTRLNVINKKTLNVISGGVNYFANWPLERGTNSLDRLLRVFGEATKYHVIDANLLKEIIKACNVQFKDDWPKEAYIECIESLQKKDTKEAILIVRRDRDIARGTGSLLSPDDRLLGVSFTDKTVLTMYRIIGSKDKKWNGNPLWIPNIKFPEKTFYGNCYKNPENI